MLCHAKRFDIGIRQQRFWCFSSNIQKKKEEREEKEDFNKRINPQKMKSDEKKKKLQVTFAR